MDVPVKEQISCESCNYNNELCERETNFSSSSKAAPQTSGCNQHEGTVLRSLLPSNEHQISLKPYTDILFATVSSWEGKKLALLLVGGEV